MTEGTFTMQRTQLEGPIPLDWGDLVSVSSTEQVAGWVQLWFQDKEGNIYMIPYHVMSNQFHEYYRHVKRQ